MSKSRITIKVSVLIVFIALLMYSCTVAAGKKAREKLPVCGVDVSSYQGDIDWKELSENHVEFAFIKATEGRTYRDKRFENNIENANRTDIAVGAYHFMSFESDGDSQADNFIDAVGDNELDLPPVIDVELYGKFTDNPPDPDSVGEILDVLVKRLSEEYGRMPIIYTNRFGYALYVSGKYEDCDIWFCDITKRPTLFDGREWTFWQYSHTGKLSGFDGSEGHIDLNVFAGSREEFREYISK